MKTPKLNKQEDFDGRIKDYLAADKLALAKRFLKRQLCINFPRRKRVPFLSLLALAILRWQGGILDMRFFNVKE